MSPRRTAADAGRTRAAIVEAAVQRASVQGLEAMSISELAADVGLSKAGVVGPFGAKLELQLAALERGAEVFREGVWEPAAGQPAGRRRLLAIGRHWFDYLVDCPLPGGCLVTTASVEWDARSGPVRDAVLAQQARWLRVLAADVQLAVAAGEIAPDRDPDATAFEINALALGLNQAVQLFADPAARAHAEAALERLLAPQTAARA